MDNKTVLFLKAGSGGRRAVTVIRDDSKPASMRFEVIFQTRGHGVGWRFAWTRAEADGIVSEVR